MTGDGVVASEVDPPAEQVDGYRDLSVIGNGATSWVYRAYQERVRRWVALKVLLADGQGDAVRRRFDRERALLAELGAHPHIVHVLDAGRTAAGRPYVAMDLCEGSLADRVDRDGPLDWPEAVELMIKIAGATQAAHDLGVLHRDIKPQNILVSRYGPLLADFGIARAKVGLGASGGTLQMSPLYAAPEVFFGTAAPTEASDVYSLGASLYAVLTGRSPFAGVSDDHVYEYLTRIQVEHPAVSGRTDLPGRLVQIVARSIAADPARRQPSAGQLADELRACLGGRPLVAASAPPPSRAANLDLTELFGRGATAAAEPQAHTVPTPTLPVERGVSSGGGPQSRQDGSVDGAAATLPVERGVSSGGGPKSHQDGSAPDGPEPTPPVEWGVSNEGGPKSQQDGSVDGPAATLPVERGVSSGGGALPRQDGSVDGAVATWVERGVRSGGGPQSHQGGSAPDGPEPTPPARWGSRSGGGSQPRDDGRRQMPESQVHTGPVGRGVGIDGARSPHHAGPPRSGANATAGPGLRAVPPFVRDTTVERSSPGTARSSPPRTVVAGEWWRPAPPSGWRKVAVAGVVGSCAVALVAVAATMVIGRTGGSSATSEPSRPSTTAAPSTTGPATAPPSGPAAAADPFPATSGFGFRPPPDPGRYRAVEQEHRRALTAALGVEVPEAQTREVVTDGRVVGFVFAHPMPETPPGVGERWATVELPGSSTGTVTADVRVAASGSNWVASWWAAPNGFVAVFGNEAALRAFLAERVPGA